MKVMFFSPHAAIWVHALPENRLACELAKAGHEISYVTCDRAFKGHCTSMAAFGYTPDLPDYRKEEVCRVCVGNADILAAGNGGRHIKLSAHLTAEDGQAIDTYINALDRERFLDAEWEGYQVGRIASYELFLTYKKMSTVLSGEEWAHYETYLRNTLRAGIAFRRIFEEARPDVVFFYSPQYAVNGICAEMAARCGATTYFVEGSSSNVERYQALRVWDWNKNGLMNPALRHWDDAKSRVTKADASRINGHFKELFAAKSFAVYSSALKEQFSTRQHFGVPEGAKLLLLTLSSFDEAFAAVVINKFPEHKLKSQVYENQFEWVRKTLAYVEGRDDLFLIIRVHPRDFPNKREAVQSEQAALWMEVLQTVPNNVAINWPQQEISLYNLLQDIDVLLTGWSATGVEALAFGIPVVTYDQGLPSYPADIHFTGRSEEAYFANIEIAVRRGRNAENAIAAYQWLAVSFSLGTLRIERESWRERIVAAMKKYLPLGEKTKAILDRDIMLYQTRRGVPFASDAAALRHLVENRAADLIEVAVAKRPARSKDKVSKDIEGSIEMDLEQPQNTLRS